MTKRTIRPKSVELSRRQFLIRSGAFGAAGLALPQFLAACGGDDGGGNTLFFEN